MIIMSGWGFGEGNRPSPSPSSFLQIMAALNCLRKMMAQIMITERLYFVDPYLTDFDAHVVARAERGGRPAIALDRSVFYPEGGGQPADAGALNDVPVVDVQVEDGVVWH